MRQPFRVSNGMRYRLIRAVVGDQRWLDQLRRSVYRELFIATFGSWDEVRHVRDTNECWDRGEVSLVEADGARVGMIQILDQSGFVEIGEFEIHPAHQGRGIGSRILSDIVDQAHKRGRTVVLSVALKNARANEFFQRCGFQHLEQTETHHKLQCVP